MQTPLFLLEKHPLLLGTNRSEGEIISDNSVAALLERFVFRTLVQWKNYNATNYAAAATHHMGLENSDIKYSIAKWLGEVTEPINKERSAKIKGTQEMRISPRTFNNSLKTIFMNLSAKDEKILLDSNDEGEIRLAVERVFDPLCFVGDYIINGKDDFVKDQISGLFKKIMSSRQIDRINRYRSAIQKTHQQIKEKKKTELKAAQAKSMYVDVYVNAILPLMTEKATDANVSAHSEACKLAVRCANEMILAIQSRVSNNSTGVFAEIQQYKSDHNIDSDFTQVFNRKIKPLSDSMKNHEAMLASQKQTQTNEQPPLS